MNINELKTILSELDIDVASLPFGSRLGADLGMDSQEIVELRAAIDRRFNVTIPAKALTKASTVQQVLDAATGNVLPQLNTSQRCESSTTVEATAEVAYAALQNLREWTQHLPHVLAVDILYDDGKFQEFKMDVASKNGVLRVRSVRRCVGALKEIEFFQPEPPNFLKQHSGGWRFLDLGDGRCRVVTYHEWIVNRTVAAQVYSGSESEQDAAIHQQLLEHATFALGCWKAVLEDNAKGRPVLDSLYMTVNSHEKGQDYEAVRA